MSDPQNTPRTAAAAARPQSANARLAELFPDLADGPTRRHWWQHRVRMTVAGVTALALVVGGVVAAQAGASGTPSYRTATASVRDVDSVLTRVATIEPVSQATVAFPVAGTVSSVDVAIGDTVDVGQTLASLDSQALTVTLHEKEAALDQAELLLSKALAGEDVSGLSGGAGSVAGGSAATMQPASAASSATPTVSDATYSTSEPVTITLAATAAPQQAGSSDLAAAQQAVLDAQRAVDEAMTAATTALTVATDVCAAVGTDAGEALDAEATTTTTAADDSLTSCRTAIDEVLTAQTAVSAAQSALATAADQLDTLLVQLTDQAAPAGQSGASSGSADLPSGGTAPSTGSGATGAATSSPSSKELIAYQKSVDAAELAVVVAQQAVAQATIVSPIAGVVVGQSLDVGDEVTAASSTAYVVIQGDGGYEATTTVPVDRVADVQVGQAATVVPDGGADPVAGEVVAVSVAPTADTTTSYRVTIALTGDTSHLSNGSTGSVSIVTAAATSSLVVPTSAVTADGDRHTVTVIDGSSSEEVSVQVGVIGDTWTEITRGVTEGQQVALADLDQPLPGSATETSTDSSTGAGATGGLPSGFPTGGFSGGPPGIGGN